MSNSSRGNEPEDTEQNSHSLRQRPPLAPIQTQQLPLAPQNSRAAQSLMAIFTPQASDASIPLQNGAPNADTFTGTAEEQPYPSASQAEDGSVETSLEHLIPEHQQLNRPTTPVVPKPQPAMLYPAVSPTPSNRSDNRLSVPQTRLLGHASSFPHSYQNRNEVAVDIGRSLLEGDKQVSTNLALYDDDGLNRGATASFLSSHSWDPRMILDRAGVFPPLHRDHPLPQLSTLRGVFFPCLQQIIGVIMFIRLPWIVGNAGVGMSLVIIFFAVLCTFLTSTSMAAIATNGHVSAGGAYYMISRSIGKDVGVSIGILLALSTAVGSSVYILGTVEVLTQYLAPQISIGKAIDSRVYGTVLLILVVGVATTGMRNFGRISLVFFAAVSLSLLAIYVGLFASNRSGLDRSKVIGFPGNLTGNFGPGYEQPDLNGKVSEEYVDFFRLFAIFFPCVTGILAGSHRSGELREPSRSIPKGTMAAVGVSSIVYFSLALLFGTVCSGAFLRTKSPSVGLQVAVVSWPHEMVALIGCIGAGLGAALATLVGSSRILHAIAKDEVLPILSKLKVTRNGEPIRALLATYFVAQCVIFVGSVDVVAGLTTMVYLLTYACLNASTALLSILEYPNWRPTWEYYHWSLSLLGALLSITYMFLISWIFALVAVVLVVPMYVFIQHRGAQVEWGDGMYALNLSVAQKRLLALQDTSGGMHAKNWRPQIMTFVELDEKDYLPLKSHILSFVSQLRKAGGLTIVSTVMEGDMTRSATNKRKNEIRDMLKYIIKKYHIEGFEQVIISENMPMATLAAIQTVGVGALRPNTILLDYPAEWAKKDAEWRNTFYRVLQNIIAMDLVVMLLKSADVAKPYPKNESVAFTDRDTIDVYWIMHDGGILTLLPYLLKKHRIWRKTRLRIFCIAELDDNSDQMEKDLKASLMHYRIDAETQVIELGDHDISEFTYEKTMRMEMRSELLNEMKKSSGADLLVTAPKSAARHGKPDKKKAEFMNTSVKLNNVFKQYSKDAAIIFCSLPTPIRGQSSWDYFEYLEALTSDLPRFVLIKGSGMEVVTAYF